MHFHHFFLEKKYFQPERIIFPSDVVHQITHVLRMSDGEIVKVLDNSGSAYSVKLEISENGKIFGSVLSKEKLNTEPLTQIHLYFPLSSREKVEWILQKGTETGICHFHPFISERSLVQNPIVPEKKSSRWKKIIKEAAEQSHRGKIPVLHQGINFMVFLNEVPKPKFSLAAIVENEENQPIAAVIEDLLIGKVTKTCIEKLSLIVGPEGGFSVKEVEKIRHARIRQVTLGPRVLRMETAAIAFPILVLNILERLK